MLQISLSNVLIYLPLITYDKIESIKFIKVLQVKYFGKSSTFNIFICLIAAYFNWKSSHLADTYICHNNRVQVTMHRTYKRSEKIWVSLPTCTFFVCIAIVIFGKVVTFISSKTFLTGFYIMHFMVFIYLVVVWFQDTIRHLWLTAWRRSKIC